MHTSDTLLLLLFIIFVWAKVFGEIFQRLGLPAVLGEILAGVVLGPYALGFVEPNETIFNIAEIGAVFLLFTVGLETRPQELLNVGRKAMGVAISGIAVPLFLGFAYVRWGMDQPASEAIFIGAAMVATSVGITARVMSDLGVLNTRAAKIILGAAIFDDILGMILLAVVVGLSSAEGIQWTHISIVLVEAIAFAVFMIFFGSRLIRRMQPGLEKMSTHDAPLILALAICLGLSVASAKIGMAAIIGAFFAGLAFADYAPQWNLQPRVHGINEFLSPYFFFTMGARLDLHVFEPDILFAAIVVAILAIISKVVGCGLPVLREGWHTAAVVGVGMTPRGEVGLIVALVGLQMQMITQSAYAIVVFMTAITTLIAPPALRLLYARQQPAPVVEEVAQV